MELDTREFQRALLKYIPTTKRDLPEIVNKRAINVAFKAIRFTPKANAGKIRRQLKKQAKGKAPLAALILNKLQGKYGRKGYYGAKMKSEVDEWIAGKIRGIGYLKSGWLAAGRQIPWGQVVWQGGAWPGQARQKGMDANGRDHQQSGGNR